MLRRICPSIHVATLAFWLAAVLCAGAVAAVVFPTMKGLDPRLAGYESYTGPHWMLAAGHIGAKVFRGLDLVAAACLPVVLMTALFGDLVRRRGAIVLVRWVLILAIAILAGYQLGVLHPAMFKELTVYWAAAKVGDNETAERHRAAFTAMHPTSTRMLGSLALALGLALVAAIAHIRPEGRPSGGGFRA